MMRKVKNIAIILFSMNILLSSIGINLFVHTCKAAGITEYSFVHHNKNGFDCPYCSDSEIKHSCNIDVAETTSCCEEEEKNTSVNSDDCCTESSEFIKLNVESNSLLKIDLEFYGFVLVEKIYETISLTESPVKSLEFLKHYSGISPPFKSKYVHYISSILE